MAWSDAARRAALEARRRNRRTTLERAVARDLYGKITKSRRSPNVRSAMIRGSLIRAKDYTGDVRSQRKAIDYLSQRGIDPKTGRKVGTRRARRTAAHIGDWANE